MQVRLRMMSGAVMLLLLWSVGGGAQQSPNAAKPPVVPGRQKPAEKAEPSRSFSSPLRSSGYTAGRAAIAAVLDKATKVESFRLAHSGSEKPLGSIRIWAYYAKRVEQNGDFAQQLKPLLMDEKTFHFPGLPTKKCMFDPGVIYRIYSHAQYVDIALCFNCNMAQAFAPATPSPALSDAVQTPLVLQGDTDNIRLQLVTMTRQAWPGDAILSKLKAQYP